MQQLYADFLGGAFGSEPQPLASTHLDHAHDIFTPAPMQQLEFTGASRSTSSSRSQSHSFFTSFQRHQNDRVDAACFHHGALCNRQKSM